MKHESHYDYGYYAWQDPIGKFGGWANLVKVEGFISESDTVVDFGCGGGYLLHNIRCKEKVGIEINEAAREQAQRMGIRCVAASDAIESEFADVIISNNALEHVRHPLSELTELHRILKPGGKMVFMVPCETISYKYQPNDINYHLYSWSPMCIGNLFTEAGFQVIESKPYLYKWPPYYQTIARLAGR
ncbi:MAG: class I SAM-dependent methyltransferase, partial [Bacteroidetes bacterium]